MDIKLGTPINQNALVDQVIDRITSALIHRELKPGDRLPTETELMTSLGVGRSSVREAVKVLQAMGIVEVHRGDGTYVATKASGSALNPMLYQLLIEPGTMKDIMELRRMFEPAFTVLAAQNATPEDIERIQQARLHFEDLVAQGKHTGDEDVRFHEAILQATRNPYVIRIGEVILKIFIESVSKSVRKVPHTAVEDHRKICDAILSKDEETIRNAVLESFRGWIDYQK